jgi:short-subunit dehydrogenase
LSSFATRYGPWAAVLGAAQGIGLAFVHEIARRGVNVLAVDVREDLLDEVVRGAAAPGIAVRGLALDLAAPDVAERLGAIDVPLGLVVHTAMLALVGPFLGEKLEHHERALRSAAGRSPRASSWAGGWSRSAAAG